MKLLVWATDIHLNFLGNHRNKTFLEEICIKVTPGNSIVITGDIAEAPGLPGHMETWQRALEAQGSKLYFVCGNHDFYRSSIKAVREDLAGGPLATSWLPSAGIIKLSDKTSLIGHDGWYDGQYDNWHKSKVDMMDYYVIQEIGPVFAATRQEKFLKIQDLAQEAADFIYKMGVEAFQDPACEELYIATHVPPFREAAVHQGKPSDPDWMPHFSSKRMGDSIRDLAVRFPQKKITVLCGHTHGEGVCYPESNVVCYTGGAEYKYPKVSNSFIVK